MRNQKMLRAVILLIGFVGTQAYPTSCKGVTEEQIVLLPTPGNCSTYIECASEEPVVMPCPNDLHWNDAAKQCDFPEIANCKEENLIRKLKAYPTSCEGVTEEQTVLLPTPGNCSTYIECAFEQPIVMPCPEGLHWNDAAKICDLPEIAKCEEEKMKAYPTSCKGVTEEQTVLLPNPGNCSTYIECAFEEPVVMPCPEGLHWNDATKLCDFPEIANCEKVKKPIQKQANSCEGVPSYVDVLLPNPADCGSYIQCVHGKPLVRPCPGGLHWSVAANRCEWPDIANCKTNSCEGVPETVDVLLPNPDDCGSYIQCVHQKPVVRPCPPGLHWSIAANRCEWPNVAQCGIASRKTWTSCKGVPETETVLLPNPKNCSTYIECTHEVPVVMPCPAGLHWNDVDKQCDYPNIAKCKETQSLKSQKDWTSCEGVPENVTVLLPNPGNCSTYIECAYEKPVVMSCPEGLHWNDAAKQCDFPEIANCEKVKKPIQKQANSCEGVPSYVDVLLPNPADCGSYIQCVHGKPLVRPCPGGLHWSVAANRCEWPDIANCKTNSCEGVPETVDVLLPNPDDCGSYIQCVHQKPVVRPCPPGLHWSIAANRCEWPDIAQCESINP